MASQTPLDRLSAVSAALRAQMRSLNIGSVEDLIAYHTSMREDPSPLAAGLGINVADLEAIVVEAKDMLPLEVVDRLTTPPPEDEMPFGALEPDDTD